VSNLNSIKNPFQIQKTRTATTRIEASKMNSLSPDVLELLNGGSERRRRFGSGSSSSSSSGGFIPYSTYIRRSQVILKTFNKLLFCSQFFMCLGTVVFGFVIFWLKEFGAKDACKLLVKLNM